MTERGPVEIGVLCYPGAQLTCVHGLTDLFGYADYFARMHATNTTAATPCTASAGDAPFLRITHWREEPARGDFECGEGQDAEVRKTRLFIVPASQTGPPSAKAYDRLADWLARTHADGATLAAVCGGVFLLAEAGLLNGRVATTHWMFAAELERRFPSVRVDAARVVIDDGDLVTAGGVLAWADLGLALVGRLLGPTVMCSTARFILTDPAGREQRLYGEFRPRTTHGDRVVLSIQHWMQANVAANVSTDALAARAKLGARTFLRRFVRATSMTPSDYQQRLRIARSQELLEFSRETIERIAVAVGYEDTRGFRRTFKRVVGLSPAEYRRRFHGGGEATSA